MLQILLVNVNICSVSETVSKGDDFLKSLKMEQENVWVIRRDKLNEFISFEGFTTDKSGDIYRFLIEHGKFIPRSEAEQNKEYKQIIPQGLIRFEDKVFVNQRLPKQTESRLNYAYSLGVGGHLNPEDDDIPHLDIIQMGLHREIAEEVAIPLPFIPKYIGLTNDEQQDVSQVHIGVWFEIQPLSMNVVVKEKEKLRGFWTTVSDLEKLSDKLESWAKVIYEDYLTKPSK